MKKILIALALMASGSPAFAYSVPQFWADTVTDTRELYKSKPQFKVGMGYGLVSHNPQASGSIPIVAWKFLDAGPLIGYNTDGSQKTGKFGVNFTLRFTRIPLGDGLKVGDFLDPEAPKWLSPYWVGIGPMYDFTSGTGLDVLVMAGWKF